MKLSSKITYATLVAALAASVYVMVRHLGLIEGLDFGCGQYYYTDIPGWEKYFSVEGVKGHLPKALYVALFFLWGWAMYKFWGWIDRK